MKYAHLEKDTNKLLGWYDDEIHSKIPTPNIEVSEEVWQEAININANCYEDGKFIVKDFRTSEEIAQQELQVKLQETKAYLNSTDWYYARKAETGEDVPVEVVEKRLASRKFIQDNKGAK